MGNRSSLLLRDEEIAQIQEETGCKYSIPQYQLEIQHNVHPIFIFQSLQTKLKDYIVDSQVWTEETVAR